MNQAVKIAAISGGVTAGLALAGGFMYSVWWTLVKDHTAGEPPAPPQSIYEEPDSDKVKDQPPPASF